MLSSKTSKLLKCTLLCLTLAVLIPKTKSDLSTDNVIIAINCGGESFTDSKGIFYEKVFLILNK